jgi:hypothetical protein
VQASEQSDAFGHRLLPQFGQRIIILDESGIPISFLMSFSLMHLWQMHFGSRGGVAVGGMIISRF